MSFAPKYQSRYEKVIAPAIETISVHNVPLKAYRVDISKSGDSILTDIVDGIAHSRMIVADVSTIGKDAVDSIPYRNGNVMYEVGLALACRQPQDILLLRDDKDRFLFDVSTIPHMHLDFTDVEVARSKLRAELMDRLKQQTFFDDARVRIAIAALSVEEVTALKEYVGFQPGAVWGHKNTRSVNFVNMISIPRLLDKGIIRTAGEFETGAPAYCFTPLGSVVAKIVETQLRKYQFAPESVKEVKKAEENPSADPAT
jgi:hypothetical protein